MATIKATILLEGSLWVGLFERTDKKGYAIARHIFGKEPTNPEVYEFVLKNYLQLKFGAPQEFKLEIKRMNPKRLQRIVRREMEKARETTQPSTHAQDYMRIELEKHKHQKKTLSKKEKEAREEKLFLLKQKKRKQKHRGH
jgi:hypothetical protein